MLRGVLLLLVLSSCKSVGSPMVDEGPVEQSIVFLIHGDADYRFHGLDGAAHQADKEALEKAVRVAERNPDAEVFIFHQRPRKRFLFLFPQDDGTFYFFRGGERRVKETYRSHTGSAWLDAETAFFERYRSRQASPEPTRILAYLGHEIPEMAGVVYHASRRNATFSLDDFSRGMAGLSADVGSFDLMVLSTCYNGTPHSIRALLPFAEYVVASPDNLHLSHLDLHPLEYMDQALDARGVSDLATDVARVSFERLSRDLQTSVTVAVYDMDRVRPYVEAVAPEYDRVLMTLENVPPARLGHVDCAGIVPMVRPDMSDGVELFYRAPRFGRSAGNRSHSGWQCWQETAASRN